MLEKTCAKYDHKNNKITKIKNEVFDKKLLTEEIGSRDLAKKSVESFESFTSWANFLNKFQEDFSLLCWGKLLFFSLFWVKYIPILIRLSKSVWPPPKLLNEINLEK